MPLIWRSLWRLLWPATQSDPVRGWISEWKRITFLVDSNSDEWIHRILGWHEIMFHSPFGRTTNHSSFHKTFQILQDLSTFELLHNFPSAELSPRFSRWFEITSEGFLILLWDCIMSPIASRVRTCSLESSEFQKLIRLISRGQILHASPLLTSEQTGRRIHPDPADRLPKICSPSDHHGGAYAQNSQRCLWRIGSLWRAR